MPESGLWASTRYAPSRYPPSRHTPGTPPYSMPQLPATRACSVPGVNMVVGLLSVAQLTWRPD